ncbi:ChaN family lipoprotein [Pleomorphovibrio marinus]|uniref:ChaN family lipoprotein n=1 Tax=Pleomorphovibrio marinus TaxID=2164132 RepID=UPI0018E4E1C9|nr:ChaN family lipoprotein [Pleomorphovibrio marinus]
MRTPTFLFFPLFFYFLALASSQGAKAQVEEQYRIYDTRTSQEISIEDLNVALAGANVVMFGEEHDDSIAHILQADLYEAMLASYGDVTLSMEMFERDVQLVLDEFLADLISEEKLVQEGRAWPNYRDYAPILALAKSSQNPVIAANVPGRYAQMVARKGLAALKELDNRASGFYETFDLPSRDDPYRKKFFDAMGEHGHGMGPEVFHAQLLRDATMAASIFDAWRANRRGKVLHLTGRFHSDSHLGTVKLLQDRRRRLELMVISCFSVNDFQDPDWGEYRGLGDVVIVTVGDAAGGE